MALQSVACPQCDEHVELDRRPFATGLDVIARRCPRCIAWIRIEGWSEWTSTHYSMTPFRDAAEALGAFPEGTWFAVADAQPQN
jgi:hypothetical protein